MRKVRYLFSLSLGQSRATGLDRRSTRFTSAFGTAAPRGIILQLVNSCPHPVSGASCVPLSPFLLSSLPFLLPPPPLAVAVVAAKPTGREMPYGAQRNSGTKMVDRCISSTPHALRVRATRDRSSLFPPSLFLPFSPPLPPLPFFSSSSSPFFSSSPLGSKRYEIDGERGPGRRDTVWWPCAYIYNDKFATVR